jgi:putative DNA primase/helicase
MHVLAGAPGTGKTTIALALAATVTTGGRWPDGSRCDVGDVLIWSGEDSPADTLAPRLIASGANMSRVHFVGPTVESIGERRPFDPATDFPALVYEAAKLPALRLMLVDPIVSAVAGDSHKNAETRRALAPLVEFAERSRCALIGISHFTKGTRGNDPVERITGSLAFAAVARIVLVTAKLNEDEGNGRVVVRAKSNIGPDGGGFEYELRLVELGPEYPDLSASRVEWGKPIEGEAREILATAEQVDEEGGGGNAKEFLRCMLATGPVLASEVFRNGEAHGYSKRQMQRARSALGARVDKLGMRGGWEWSLPKVPLSPEDTEDAGQVSLAPSAPSAASSPSQQLGEEF